MGCSSDKDAVEKENTKQKPNQNVKENEKKEQETKEQERLEQERKDQEGLKQEKLEQEKKDQERLDQEKKEQERLDQEKKEQERLEQEKKEQERLEQEKKAQELKEQQEKEQKEKEQKPQDDTTTGDEQSGNEVKSHNSSIPEDNGHYLDISLKNKKNNVFVPTDADLQRFQRDGLKRHNYYRKYHQVGPMELTKKLNDFAQKYAETLAAKNKMQHSSDKERDKLYGDWTGENLYYFWSSSTNLTVNGAQAVDDWYDEIKDYDFKKGCSKNGGVVGHFTQLVWKGSSQLGIGVARSSQNSVFVVGNYHFGGNFNKAELNNVFPAKA